ncbi:hypothetical protein ACHAW5_000029 [Stephanodiscus triporus]|uniref:Uncharacterized protein n=1 Tax=Stephanodiscus triporus TaxID=2934178 RepID=A0ABD3QPZ2_9STRA
MHPLVLPSPLVPVRSMMAFDCITTSVDLRDPEDFPMGCSFSPDGSCVLTATALDGEFRLYDTPWRDVNRDRDDLDDEDDREKSEEGRGGGDERDGANCGSLNQNYQPHVAAARNRDNLPSRPRLPWRASLTSHQGGPTPPSSSSSYAWYPRMTSSDPSTAVFVTCRGSSSPIHLIDAYTSELRASYRPYNSVDAMEGPTVVAFSSDGSKVYGTGFRSDRTIAAFDVSIPGKDGMIVRLGKTRRSADGQKGVPSALAFPGGFFGGSREGGGWPSNVFAVGTYSPASIYIYDDRTSGVVPAGTIVLHGGTAVVGHGRSFSRKRRRRPVHPPGGRGDLDDDDRMGAVETTGVDDSFLASTRADWFHTRAGGGVTQLAWAPSASSNPHVLFSASRRSDAVLSWDVRAMSGLDASGNDRVGGRGRGGRRTTCGGLRSYSRGNGDNGTNQRLEFELDDVGRRMFVGSNDEGLVRVYDVSSGRLEGILNVIDDNGATGVGAIKKDAVNGLSYFCNVSGGGAGGKYDGLLAVAVGSRRYDNVQSDDDDYDYDDGRVDRVRRLRERPPGCLQLHGLNITDA